MEFALFHPEQGYYSKHINTVGGTRADFSTTATLSPLLGKAFASKIQAWIKEDKIKTIHLIEIGAGDGSLAQSVLKHLPLWIRFMSTYHIVETSKPLRLQQQAKLKNKAIWHHSLPAALEASKGQAFLFSNELVDAFPVRVFRHNGTALQELHIKEGEEHFLPCQSPPQSVALSNPPHHQRREVHESYHQWLKSWAPLWKSGRMITIDYGDNYPDVYYRRPNGSLRAYFMHQSLQGKELYLNIGRQDITCDVNFTDLISWSNDLEISTDLCQSQREFLLPFHDGSEVHNFLLAKDGAGSAFKVLCQRR